jgi:hypothetical protein
MVAISNGLHAGTIDASTSQSLGPILKALHDEAIVVLYLVTSVGGTIFAVLLYRSRLVPRRLAVPPSSAIRCCWLVASWTCSM